MTARKEALTPTSTLQRDTIKTAEIQNGLDRQDDRNVPIRTVITFPAHVSEEACCRVHDGERYMVRCPER